MKRTRRRKRRGKSNWAPKAVAVGPETKHFCDDAHEGKKRERYIDRKTRRVRHKPIAGVSGNDPALAPHSWRSSDLGARGCSGNFVPFLLIAFPAAANAAAAAATAAAAAAVCNSQCPPAASPPTSPSIMCMSERQRRDNRAQCRGDVASSNHNLDKRRTGGLEEEEEAAAVPKM